MKKWIKYAALFCSVILSMGTFFGCTNNSNPNSTANNSGGNEGNRVAPVLDTTTDLSNNKEEYFYGLGELTTETGTSIEPNVTNEYVAKMAGVLGVKTQRVWMHITNIIERDPDKVDGYRIKEALAEEYHDYFAKLKENGVERICAVSHSIWHPYDYFYHIDGCIPNPWGGEYDYYIRFLDEFENFYIMMQTEFPEIDYWEIHNEVNMFGNQVIFPSYHKEDPSRIYSSYQKAVIAMDMCWYANRGVKSVNPKSVIVFPGPIVYNGCGSWINDVYAAINSKCLPTGQPFYDTNTYHYFGIASAHPYPGQAGTIEIEKEIQEMNEIYDVMKANGDGDKKMWLTESGMSDSDHATEENPQEHIAEYYPLWLEAVKKLDYVETLFLFRLTDLYANKLNSREDTFGLFYSPNDSENLGAPKPAAISIYQYQHGKDADLTPLYWYYNQKKDQE